MNRLRRKLYAYALAGSDDGAMLADLNWRRRWAWLLASPAAALRRCRLLFARWSMLPGDVFEEFQRDTFYVVLEVHRDRVRAVPVAGGLLGLTARGLDVLVILECWFPRRYDPTTWGTGTDHWMPARQKDAAAARRAAGFAA